MALWQVMWPPKEQKTWKQRLTNEVDDSGKHGKSRFIMIKECFFHCMSLWLKTMYNISLFWFLLQFEKGRVKLAIYLFESRQQQKWKQRDFVLHFWFMVLCHWLMQRKKHHSPVLLLGISKRFIWQWKSNPFFTTRVKQKGSA